MTRKLTKIHKENISKGKIGKLHPHKGGFQSDEKRKKLSISAKKRIGNKAANWKEEDIKYLAIHRRIEKKYGTPKYCEICKKINKEKYHWSNKNHKYSLEKKYWQRLCVSCHKKYDIKTFNFKIFNNK